MKKIELLHFTVAKKMTTARHLARINWIRAVDKICVEQLICCQKCRAIACRAIAIRAIHPHSFFNLVMEATQLILKGTKMASLDSSIFRLTCPVLATKMRFLSFLNLFY
jgi:hypothetical protein